MKKQDKYEITNVTRGTTSRGSNYFDIEAINRETGEVVACVYFGNTRPKRLLDIVEKQGKESVYRLAIIQPHTSRDKKTGKFTSYRRAAV